MATAGASTLAGLCGLPALVAPLLALAVVQALWIPVAAVLQHRRTLRHAWSASWSIDVPAAYTGIHTVPLGLAVIAGGFADRYGAVLPPLAWALFVLTWLTVLACTVTFLWSLVRHGLELERLDGAWFLVPAALLGAAIASVDLGAIAPAASARDLDLLALAGAVAGWLGYWGVAVVAAIRVARFGIGGVPQAPWWIAMGCAGLAAAATGHMLESTTRWPAPLAAALLWATAAVVACAVVLCVPVLVASAAFLWRRCRFRGAAAWPPTFSTAVFALGCLQAGEMLRLPALRLLGFGAGLATLVLWAVTAAWNAGRRMVTVFTDRGDRDAR